MLNLTFGPNIMLRKSGIEYLEKPVTKEEKTIASILENLFYIFKSGNISHFASLFREDAILEIFSERQGIVRTLNINEFINEIARPHLLYHRNILYRNTHIKIKNDKEAFAFFERLITFKNSRPSLAIEGCIKFIKEKDKWLITRFS
ncbi:MAG: hypothetical protein AAB930_04085 [Patescibacteria group bacterium]